MSGPGTDELMDSDPLLSFEEESGENRVEMPPVAPGDGHERLDEVERTIDQTQRDLVQIRSEIATLVGAIEDIKKRANRRPTPELSRPQPESLMARAATATLGVLLGVAVGVMVWMQLGAAAPVPVTAAPHEETAPAPTPENIAPPVAAPAATPVTPPVEKKPVLEKPAPTPRDQQSEVRPATTLRDQSAERPAPLDRPAPVNFIGALTVDAAPAGDVSIDRETAGRTPLRLNNLRAGSHLVWIERDGYQRWTRVVQVQADKVTRLSAELEPIAR